MKALPQHLTLRAAHRESHAWPVDVGLDQSWYGLFRPLNNDSRANPLTQALGSLLA